MACSGPIAGATAGAASSGAAAGAAPLPAFAAPDADIGGGVRGAGVGGRARHARRLFRPRSRLHDLERRPVGRRVVGPRVAAQQAAADGEEADHQRHHDDRDDAHRRHAATAARRAVDGDRRGRRFDDVAGETARLDGQQIGRRLVHDVGADPPLAQRVPDHQRVVADDVDETGNARGNFEDAFLGLAREELGVGGAGGGEARLDVFAELLATQRQQPAVDGDALAELAKAGIAELLAELGLTREDDLEDLLLRRLEVRQQAEVLQHRVVEVLRFVDQQRDVAPLAQLLEQELVQALQHVEPLAVVHRQVELAEDVLEDLVEGDVGVEDEHRTRRLVEVVEQLLQQRRLAGAGLADECDEALALGDAVVQRRERLAVAGVQVQELRIGRDVKRPLLHLIEIAIHGQCARPFCRYRRRADRAT